MSTEIQKIQTETGKVEILQLRGTVEKIFFSNQQFSAGVLRLANGDTEKFGGKVTLSVGNSVILEGKYVNNPKFGKQFEVLSFSFDTKPVGLGLVNYLSNNPNFKEIGPTRARAIANLVGDSGDFEDILFNKPELIIQAAKLPRTQAQNIIEILQTEWKNNSEINAAAIALAKFELTHNQISKLIAKYKSSAVNLITENPYCLIKELDGFGFRRVDDMALKAGISKDHPGRIQAGVIATIDNQAQNGHCWIDMPDLLIEANTLLILDSINSLQLIRETIEAMIAEQKDIVCIDISNDEFSYKAIAKISMFKMEQFLFNTFSNVAKNPTFFNTPKQEIIESIQAFSGNKLNQAQFQSCELSTSNNICVVTGAAGTGKSFVMSTIARLYQSRGLKLEMVAPTGKAADRLRESTGFRAQTIHRLLGYQGSNFLHNEKNKLDLDAIIIDEFSMVSVELAYVLFRAIDFNKTAIIIAGDENQLPPVQPGNPLRDILAQNLVPTVTLTEVMRQAGPLRENSLAILNGKMMPTYQTTEKGVRPWYVINKDTNREPLQCQKAVIDIVQNWISDKMGFDLLREFQLITPMKKGDLGTKQLNIILQKVLQDKLYGMQIPDQDPEKKQILYYGDKVIQTKNNRDKDISNGSTGIITAINPELIEVEFDYYFNKETKEWEAGKVVEFDRRKNEDKDLELAYCLTIHKMQGSEVKCCMIICHIGHKIMLHRNLIYTAVTRSREVCLVMADKWAIGEAMSNIQTDKRRTFLQFGSKLLEAKIVGNDSLLAGFEISDSELLN